MEKLLRGALKFNNDVSYETRELLARLARDGQRPDTLFVTCADSRIDVGLVTQSKPGDLFVIRNVGNLVPLFHEPDTSVGAAVGYALSALADSIKVIAVCGHSECGAMKALAFSHDLSSVPHLADWLASGKGENADDALETTPRLGQKLPEYDSLSQQNVLAQVDNLTTYPEVRRRVENGTLHLVGLWFDIGRAEVQVYDPAQKRFVVVDETLIKTHFGGGGGAVRGAV